MSYELNLFDLINQHKPHDEILSLIKTIFEQILYKDSWTNEFYLHPLGFYYCRLAENPKNQIRLHIWIPGYPMKQDLFIHDHYYDLCSWILCGKILDSSYEVLPSKNKSSYTKFTSGYIDNENNRILYRTEEFQTVKKIKEKTLIKGQKYFIPKEQYHSNQVFFDESEITATLVFTYNHKENHSPNVIGLSTNEYHLEDRPKPISISEIKKIIKICKAEVFKTESSNNNGFEE